MRFCIIPICFFLLLAGCSTYAVKNDRVPELIKVKVSKIEKDIANGDYGTAVQDILFLRDNSTDISDKKTGELLSRAISLMKSLLKKVLKNEEYKKALVLSRSLSILEEKNIFDEKKLLLAISDKMITEKYILSALFYFQTSLSKYDFDKDILLKYGDLALIERKKSILRNIVEKMISCKIKVPETYLHFLKRKELPGEMIKGSVTIYVDKGIVLEGRVGYANKSIGSGFFIDKRGYLITNYHVIESEVDPEYEGYSRLFIKPSSSNTLKIPAKVVGWDKVFDIALLKVEIEPEYVFSFSCLKKYDPGEKVFAIGSPAGLQNTLTSGIISATGRRLLQMGDALQVDVPINPGNSGGAVFNQAGDIIGVAFAGIEQFEGINFAIPIIWVKKIITKLYGGKEVEHPWLGMGIRETKKGLEVLYTIPGESASRGGLRDGDLILSIDDNKPVSISDAQSYIISSEIGTLVRIKYERNGGIFEKILVLKKRPSFPMEIANRRDFKENLFVPLFGMKIKKIGITSFSRNYVIQKVYKGLMADENGFSENDSLTLKKWYWDNDKKYVIILVNVKKRKAGYMESMIQLAAGTESTFFL